MITFKRRQPFCGTVKSAMADDTPPHVGPDDTAHRQVRDVIDNIGAGRIVPAARKALRGALDRAEAPKTGRAASDEAVGKAFR